MIRTFLKQFLPCSLCLPVLLVGSIALAADPAPPAQPESQAGAVALEEIVVTAEKRSERIGDVPIAIVPVTSAMLAAQHMETTQDLELVVPALVYTSFAGFALPYLRGIGSDLAEPNADPNVATYIDGAFISTNQATIQNLLGVQQIEVLEGPQGTLYGRNAVGGAINLTTLTPTQTPSAMVALTIGDYARRELSAHLSGAVTDDLSVGLYVAGTQRNTYYTRMQPDLDLNYLGDQQPSNETQEAARIKAVYTPVDWIKLTASAEMSHTSSFESDAVRQIDPNGLGFVLFPNLPKIIAPYTVLSNSPEWDITTQTSGTLREEVNLDWSRVLGISNYRNVSVNGGVDADGTQAPLLASVQAPLKSQQWSQELQLISADSSTIRWVGGLYLFHEQGGFLPDSVVSPTLFPPNAAIQSNYANVVTKSFAAFGQTTFPLVLDALHLTLGGRYTHETKDFNAFDQNVTLGNVVTSTTDYPTASKSWNSFTPKVTLDYKWEGGALDYATFSEGFKSGVFNLTVPSSPGPVNPEKLYAYELGAKIPFWDRRVSWNSSAYYYSYLDLQVQAYLPSTDLAILQNAASARAYGFETNVSAAVTDKLTLTGALSAEHSWYSSFPTYQGIVGGASTPVNATGNELARAPKWVATTGVQYVQGLPAGSMLFNINDYYNAGFYWTAQNSTKQSAYTVLDASLTYTFPAKAWSVQLWGKNLTNRLYESGLTEIAGFGSIVQDAPPRMYGATAMFQF